MLFIILVVIARMYQKGVASLIVLAILALAGTGGVVIASDTANPGDALYSIDLATERIRLALATNTETRAQVHLELAQERLEEAMELAQQNREEHMVQALERYENHIENAQQNTDLVRAQGRDVDRLLERFAENHARHQEVLSGVLDRVPEQAHDAVQRAIENNERNYQRLIDGFPEDQRLEIQERLRERIEVMRVDEVDEAVTDRTPSPSPVQDRRGQ